MKSLRVAIDKGIQTESLNEALQLAFRQLPFDQVHEVRANAPFGKEAQRLSRVGVFLQPEDLNFHALLL